MELGQPKISNQELQDIQKLVSFEDSKSVVSRKDEISTIIQQRSLLSKRQKPTTEKLMKDAQDALVYQNSSSALLGGENAKLNSENLQKNKVELSQSDYWKGTVKSDIDAVSISRFSMHSSMSQASSVGASNSR